MLFVGSVSSLAPDLRVKYLLRYLAPHVLSAVARRYRDFASSEDAVQEALIAAASQRARSGVPNNLVGCLVQVAQRGMVDQVRSEISRRNREAAVLEESAIATPSDAFQVVIRTVGLPRGERGRCSRMPCRPLQDTTALEARALAEVAARPKSEATDRWISESPFAVQAELAALHGNPRRAATVLRGALEHGVGPD